MARDVIGLPAGVKRRLSLQISRLSAAENRRIKE